MNRYYDDDFCFACGFKNPQGLKLKFIFDEKNDQLVSKTTFSKYFQGWKNVLHGGIISTVLDEIMVKATSQKGYQCVTAELNVRFKRPALLNGEYTITGKVTEVRNKIILTEGCITNGRHHIFASATGKYFILKK
jgi:uncharacterized protein (TIGR00369 family)